MWLSFFPDSHFINVLPVVRYLKSLSKRLKVVKWTLTWKITGPRNINQRNIRWKPSVVLAMFLGGKFIVLRYIFSLTVHFELLLTSKLWFRPLWWPIPWKVFNTEHFLRLAEQIHSLWLKYFSWILVWLTTKTFR